MAGKVQMKRISYRVAKSMNQEVMFIDASMTTLGIDRSTVE